MSLTDDLLAQIMANVSPTRPRQVSQISNLPSNPITSLLNPMDLTQLGNPSMVLPSINDGFNPISPIDPYSIMTPNRTILDRYNDYQNQAKQLGLINNDASNQLQSLIDQTNQQLLEVPNDVSIGKKLMSALLGFGGGYTGNQALTAQGNQLLFGGREQLENRRNTLQDRKNKLQLAQTENALNEQVRIKTQLDTLFNTASRAAGDQALAKMNGETQKTILALGNFYENIKQNRQDARLNQELEARGKPTLLESLNLFIPLGIDNAVDVALEFNRNGNISPENIKKVNKAIVDRNTFENQLRDAQLSKLNNSGLVGGQGFLASSFNPANIIANVNQYGTNKDIDLALQKKGNFTIGSPEINNIIERVSTESGIPSYIMKSVVTQESSGNPNAISKTGVRGLFQFTKETGAKFGLVNDEDFFNPEKQARAFVGYWNYLEKEYNGYLPAMLADYNGGPERAKQLQNAKGDVTAINTSDKAKDKETADYVKKIMGRINSFENYYGNNPEFTSKFMALSNDQVEKKTKLLLDLNKQVDDILFNPKLQTELLAPDGSPVLDPITQEPRMRPLSPEERLAQFALPSVRVSLMMSGLDDSDPAVKAFMDSRFSSLNPKVDQESISSIADRLIAPKNASDTTKSIESVIGEVYSNKNMPKDMQTKLLAELIKRADEQAVKNYDVKELNKASKFDKEIKDKVMERYGNNKYGRMTLYDVLDWMKGNKK